MVVDGNDDEARNKGPELLGCKCKTQRSPACGGSVFF